jgi:class 3 adenylate cyclase
MGLTDSLKPTMRCSQCGAENRANARFCDACGLVLAGRSFGSASPRGTGTVDAQINLQTIGPELPQGEPQTVTVLFADLKGSTELMEALDPEEARTIVDPALRIMVDAVTRYEGHVVQSTGDGVFALFGAPGSILDRFSKLSKVSADQVNKWSENRAQQIRVIGSQGGDASRVLQNGIQRANP